MNQACTLVYTSGQLDKTTEKCSSDHHFVSDQAQLAIQRESCCPRFKSPFPDDLMSGCLFTDPSLTMLEKYDWYISRTTSHGLLSEPMKFMTGNMMKSRQVIVSGEVVTKNSARSFMNNIHQLD